MPSVDQVAKEYLARIDELDPNDATDRGVLGHDGELTDYSPDGARARAEVARRALTELDRLPARGEGERLAATVTRDRLQAILALHDSGDWMRCLSVFGPSATSRRVFDLMRRRSDADWELIATRMEAVPACLTGTRRSLEMGLEQGATSARHQALVCAAQARNWGGRDGRPGFFRSLVAGAGERPSALGSRLDSAAGAADRAYLDFAAFLEEGYAPRVPDRDGCGPELYPIYSQYFNAVDLDLDQTYEWGWEELARIEEEMAQTAERIAPGEGLAGAVRTLETDPERAIQGEENFRTWNQEFLDATMAELQGVHFDIPEPVLRVEAMIAPPGGSPAMYYTAPAQDFSRPGRTWYPTQGRERFPLWTEVATAYHEGVPGHHLQLGHICYLADHLTPFQGMLGLVSGHVEGWALYAEYLMGELGYLDNPDYYLGMLANQAFRAARVVVDIGLHLHRELPQGQHFHPGERWSRELAVEFMVTRARRSPGFSAGEVDRYLGMPAQAISYKVGERVWLEVREEARRSWGPDFSLRAFHRRALDLGAVGLNQLREQMRGWQPEAA